jgi:serine/threonine protein kinase/tetratricopeptide (TPR) repeat protein
MSRVGQQFGSYFLVKRLGRGGFGEVWLAERRTRFVTTRVAVKLPLAEEVDYFLIKQEAEIWERASGHPNVLSIIEADEYDGQVMIVSEFAPDGSLEDLLRKMGGSIPVKRAVELSIGILSGLEFLHSKDIIHRDLKPGNILLQGKIPRLSDFGISRLMRTNSASLSSAGTPSYMAPEAFDGKRTVQTDIWSAGVMLYQMIAGTLPFSSDVFQELVASIILHEPKPVPPNIPVLLRGIIEKALAKSPAQRYESASEMKRNLENYLYAAPPSADSSGTHIGDQPTLKHTSINPVERGKTSIAILPFRNLTGASGSQFYEFSLADAVITELARLQGLTVRPSSVIAKYQGKSYDAREAGMEMSVTSVLSAAFFHSDTRLRVTAQLLDVSSGEIIWSDRIDCETSDIFALQDEITHRIIHGLEFDLTIGERERLGIRPTKSNAAYEEYLQGRDKFARFIFRTLLPVDCEAAIANFRAAIEIDPNFALAWSGLGACYANKVFRGLGDAEDYKHAEDAFRRALELDVDITEARVLMGFIYLSRGEKKRARSEAAYAVSRFPNEAPPYFLKAVIHRLDGEYDEALKTWDRFERVHPRSTVVANWNRARLYSLRGQHGRAIEEIEKGAALEPDHPFIRVLQGQILYNKGDIDEAARLLKLVIYENPHLEAVRPLLAIVLAARGETDEAREQLNESVLRKASADYDFSYWVASAFALLGQIEKAFEWLEISVKLGLEDQQLLANDKALANLRSDDRFARLLQSISEKSR